MLSYDPLGVQTITGSQLIACFFREIAFSLLKAAISSLSVLCHTCPGSHHTTSPNGIVCIAVPAFHALFSIPGLFVVFPLSLSLSGPVLRDTARLSQRYPPITRYGVFGVSTWPLGCDTPSPFSKRFPLGEHAKWRWDTPPQKGYLSDTRAIPFENKANGCDTPLCDTISKGYCAIWGGISHWAAKLSHSGGQGVRGVPLKQPPPTLKPEDVLSKAGLERIFVR